VLCPEHAARPETTETTTMWYADQLERRKQGECNSGDHIHGDDDADDDVDVTATTQRGISATIPNMGPEQGFDQGELKSEIEECYFTERLKIETIGKRRAHSGKSRHLEEMLKFFERRRSSGACVRGTNKKITDMRSEGVAGEKKVFEEYVSRCDDKDESGPIAVGIAMQVESSALLPEDLRELESQA